MAARGVAASAGTSRITILYRCEPGGAQKKGARRASASPRARARAASAAPSAAARLATTWQFRSGGGALQLRASRACTAQRSRKAAARRPRVTAIVPARQAWHHAVDVIEFGRRKQPPGGGRVRSFFGRRQWPSRGRRALCLLQIVRQHSRHHQPQAGAAEKEREGEERVSHRARRGRGRLEATSSSLPLPATLVGSMYDDDDVGQSFSHVICCFPRNDFMMKQVVLRRIFPPPRTTL